MIRIPSIDSASSSSLNYHQHFFSSLLAIASLTQRSLSYFFQINAFSIPTIFFLLCCLLNTFAEQLFSPFFLFAKKILYTYNFFVYSLFSFVKGRVKKFLWHHFFMLKPCLSDTSLILIKDSTIFLMNIKGDDVENILFFLIRDKHWLLQE